MKKYVFIDIDGTLRDHVTGIPETALKALERAARKGHNFIICTGRARGMIPDDIPLRMFDGIIAGGGSYLEYKGQVMRDKHLDDNIIGSFVENFSKNDIPFSLEARNNIYMSAKMEESIAAATNFFIKDMSIFSRISPVGEYLSSPVPVGKISFRLTREQYDSFENSFSDTTQVISLGMDRDGYIHMELIGKECDKGTALRLFCEYTCIDRDDTVAFGDSMNDADMFREAKLSVCMGNAPDAAKELADIVTRDILSDGLYLGFYKAGLFL